METQKINGVLCAFGTASRPRSDLFPPKKGRTVLAGVACLLMLFGSFASALEFAGGTGDPNDPYQIATAAQLLQINGDPNLADKHFLLVDDIDLDPNGPRGQVFAKSPLDLAFKGLLDGQNYAIHNLTIHAPDREEVGLFSRIRSQAHVKRLMLLSVDVTGKHQVGALAGENDGVLSDCVVNGTVTGVGDVGGLSGLTSGKVLRCSAEVIVTGNRECGGLIGLVSHGHIIDCQSSGSVLGESTVGGLVGMCSGSTFVANCLSSCAVAGRSSIGGLIGMNVLTNITYSGATGDVKGDRRIGGLVGKDGGGRAIIACYARGGIQGGAHVGGLIGDSVNATIQHSYYQGHIQGHPYSYGDSPREYQPDAIGGLVGDAAMTVLIGCYAAGELTIISDEPQSNIGGLVGKQSYSNLFLGCLWDEEVAGVEVCCSPRPWATVEEVFGGTSREMQSVDTYIQAGWDFESHWTMPDAGGYPRLLWEKNEGNGG